MCGMSRIYWHGEHHDSELRGSERAYMGITCEDIAGQVVRIGFGERHPFENLLPPGASLPNLRGDREESVRTYLRSFMGDNTLIFGGQTHHVFDLVLNTVIATGSPYLALLARLHGTCEAHAWVAEEHRDWMAEIITEGRRRNIFRPDQGWESVADHLRNGDGGNVYTSYSVCDQFPSTPEGWMDQAWPPEQIGRWDYSALTEEQEAAVSARQDEWLELPDAEQWRLSAEAVHAKWWLQMTPDNLTQPVFTTGATLWDAVASSEWRGEVAADA